MKRIIPVLVVFIALIGSYFWFMNQSNTFAGLPEHKDERRPLNEAKTTTIKPATQVDSLAETIMSCELSANPFLRNTRTETISAYILMLQQQELSVNEIMNIARQAGLSPAEMLKFFLNNKLYKNEEIIEYPAITLDILSPEERTALEKIVINQNEINIRNILGEGISRKIFGLEPFYTFLFRISKRSDNELMSLLNSQGFLPIALDIVNAIENDKKNELVINLIQQTKDNKNVYWNNGRGLQSVSLAAARKFNYSALQSWLSKVDPPTIQGNVISELDLLPTPSHNQLNKALATVEVLVNYGRSIQTLAGYNKLKAWLPGEWFERNKQKLLPPEINISAELLQYVNELEKNLSKFKNGYRKAENFCYPDKTASNFLNKRSLELSTKIRKDKPKPLLNTFFQAALPLELLTVRTQLLNALAHENWSNVFELLLNFSGEQSEQLLLNGIMEYAITVDAPSDIIYKLLALEANYPEDAIQILARNGYLQLTADLLYSGLDINYVDYLGMTAVDVLVGHKSGKKNNNDLLVLLLNQGVVFSREDGSFDSLNHALMNVEKIKITEVYIRTLIDFGAKINSSHIEQMKRLEVSNHSRYQEIIDSIPELFFANENNEIDPLH